MGSAQDEMRAYILRPFPSVSLPHGLTREQELTYAVSTLEQHMENTKDKIRLNALCEAANASKEPTTNPSSYPPYPDPRPNAFREAARQTWKRGTPPPVVKQSRRIQPVFHLQQESNSHVAIARRAIARLNDYDRTMKPAIEAVKLAREGRDAISGAANPGTARLVKNLGAAKEPVHVAASRDPRLAPRRT